MYSRILSATALIASVNADLRSADNGFVKYFDYNGDAQVGGAIEKITTLDDGETQEITISLSGLPKGCGEGPTEGVGNSCGMHIHEGTDCTSNAGNHYFNEGVITNDPWGAVAYTSSSEGTFSGTTSIRTGLAESDIKGRTFIVHDVTGKRIACTTLAPVTNKPLPILRDGFSSAIEAVITNKKYAIFLEEFYDPENNRFRMDRRDHDNQMIELCDLNSKRHVVVTRSPSNGWTCENKDFNSCARRVADKDGHLKTASSMLEQANDLDYTFQGKRQSRGYNTEMWRSAEKTSGFGPFQMTYSMDWHFRAPDWKSGRHGEDGISKSPIPVAAVLKGSSKNLTAGTSHDFLHTYNFMEYHPFFNSTMKDDYHFEISPRWNCPAATTDAPAADTTTAPAADTTTAPAADTTAAPAADTTGVPVDGDGNDASTGRRLIEKVVDAVAPFVPGFLAGYVVA